MSRRRTNPEFLNGVPELLILRLLSRKPMHGYELVQTIAALTSGRLEFGQGCVYPLLHRLELEGTLTSERALVAGRRRVIYHVSRAGKQRLAQTTRRWQDVVAAVQHVLQGDGNGRVGLA